MSSDLSAYAGATVIGAVTGIRGSALAGSAAIDRMVKNANTMDVELASPRAAAVAARSTVMVMGAVEAVAHRLPVLRDHPEDVSILVHAVSGGICGAAFCSARRKNILLGATLGVLGSIGMTIALSRLHHRTGKHWRVPEMALGLAEDMVSLGAGVALNNALGRTA